ncbi:MAG: Stp1/IreP family PP2C-type Ser/Thr phosphatase [Clostridiales bacterium]|jgi:protein phosphatase|nr:Stp1/IreP family PP2C-type Ser/Thr phosphatase [Clostridiales bacterium]
MYGAGRTDKGQVRSNNEDAIFFSNEPVGVLPNLYIVSDGMGGHRSGEVASQNAVELFRCYVLDNRRHNSWQSQTEGLQEDKLLDYMISGVNYANNAVYELSLTSFDLSGMGATFSACVIWDGRVYIAHVGDSRVYAAGGGKISQLTIDHTYVNEMVRSGRMNESEAKTHPKRNIITRALGVDPDLEVDGYVVPLDNTDIILLCSDGLSNMLTDEELCAVVVQNTDAERKVDELITLSNQRGGMDNISVVLVDMKR